MANNNCEARPPLTEFDIRVASAVRSRWEIKNYELYAEFRDQIERLQRECLTSTGADKQVLKDQIHALTEKLTVLVLNDAAYAAELANSTVPRLGTRRADLVLNQLSSLIPRSKREAIAGDLTEDIAEFRQQGWSECRLMLHLLWQFFWIILPRLTKWGVFAWVVKTLHSFGK